MSKTIEIPKGYTPSRVEIKDGLVCLVFESIETPKEFIPKDGDFCIWETGGEKFIFIFKSEPNLIGCGCEVSFDLDKSSDSIGLFVGGFFTEIGTLTPATEAEKQLLLSEIDKAGLIWNAEKKRIEKKRWRAEIGERYYCIYSALKPDEMEENDDDGDEDRYVKGNYFQTEQQAAEFGNLSKELLFHFHQEDEVLTKIKELLK